MWQLGFIFQQRFEAFFNSIHKLPKKIKERITAAKVLSTAFENPVIKYSKTCVQRPPSATKKVAVVDMCSLFRGSICFERSNIHLKILAVVTIQRLRLHCT